MISLFGGQELLSQHRNLLKISMLFFFKKKKVLRKERRGDVMGGKIREGKVRRQGCGRGQANENAKKNAKKKWKKRGKKGNNMKKVVKRKKM